MIPHERSLVEKWQGRPFAIVGVNSDGTDNAEGLAKYREQAKKMNVTWRSFRDEVATPRTSEIWRVQGWPTVFYIDHEGVIQKKDHGDATNDEAWLEGLIARAEAAAKAKGDKPAK